MILPPLPPVPPRCGFDSDEEYNLAIEAHQRMVRERSETMKTEEAIMIVIVSIVAISGGVLVFGMAYIDWGIKGPVGVALAAGLFWALVSRVRTWL